MKVGTAMVRVDDGMRGVVESVELLGTLGHTELRVVYIDRGERMVAGKREKWEPVAEPPRKLRLEEVQLVAIAADARLRALDLNETYRWWDNVSLRNDPHDPELVRVIAEYLLKRA